MADSALTRSDGYIAGVLSCRSLATVPAVLVIGEAKFSRSVRANTSIVSVDETKNVPFEFDIEHNCQLSNYGAKIQPHSEHSLVVLDGESSLPPFVKPHPMIVMVLHHLKQQQQFLQLQQPTIADNINITQEL